MGGLWKYAYDAEGNLSTVTNPDSEITTFRYFSDPAHYLKEIEDPYNRIGSQYEYDADGRLSAIIDENGNRIEQTWQPGSFSGSVQDRRGNLTQFTYDERGNIVSTTDPDLQTTTYTYDDPLNPDLENHQNRSARPDDPLRIRFRR